MRLRSLDVVRVVVISSAYLATVSVLAPISFGIINIRVADALRCFIPLFGWPAILGIFIGQMVANMASPLGLIDLLSPLIVLPASIMLYKFREKSILVGYLMIWITLSLWVSFMISLVTDTNYIITLSFVALGIFISDVILPYGFLKAILRIMPSWGWKNKLGHRYNRIK